MPGRAGALYVFGYGGYTAVMDAGFDERLRSRDGAGAAGPGGSILAALSACQRSPPDAVGPWAWKAGFTPRRRRGPATVQASASAAINLSR